MVKIQAPFALDGVTFPSAVDVKRPPREVKTESPVHHWIEACRDSQSGFSRSMASGQADISSAFGMEVT